MAEEKKEAGADRRRYPRLLADVTFRYCDKEEEDSVQRQTVTKDISLVGLRMYSDIRFEAGKVLFLEIIVPGHLPIKCHAKVVWEDKFEGGNDAEYDMGLEYLDISDTDRSFLSDFIEKM